MNECTVPCAGNETRYIGTRHTILEEKEKKMVVQLGKKEEPLDQQLEMGREMAAAKMDERLIDNINAICRVFARFRTSKNTRSTIQ